MDTDRIVNMIPEGVEILDKKDEFTTSNGFRFKIKPVPPFLLMDAQRRFTAPKPPLVYIQDKETTEENPNDPDYMEKMRQYQTDLGNVANAILLARGTELLECPEGVPDWQDNAWSDELEELDIGVDIPKVGRRRYFCWLKYIVLTRMDDFSGLANKVASAGGVTREEDVAVAAADFRRDEAGAVDPGVPVGQGSGDGNTGAITVLGASS